ncbi:MAG TPA: glycosyltransferase [Paludibacteraceae bacterium]|nr:glycosyltransferase [Paludibacteraceae bacterium]
MKFVLINKEDMERICFLGYSEPDGQSFGNGVVRVIYNQARILRKRGYEVYFYHLFSSEEYKHLNTFLRENNIDLAFWHMTTLKVKRHIHLVCPLVCLWHSTPFFSYENYAEVFCKKYHVISWIRKILCCKWVNLCMIKVHSIYNALLFLYVTACSDKMVLLSKHFIPKFFAAKIYPQKVTSISNMLTVNANAVDMDLSKKKKEVLFVGRLDNKFKRVDLLLRIWAKVEKCHDDWILNICGDGEDRGMLKNLNRELGLQHVYFKGFVNPDEYYKTASIFCMTSAYEGWGLVIEEAAAFGCVPIAFDSFEAVSDLISNGENGWLVSPFDVTAYANVVCELIENEGLRMKLAEKARLTVNRFNPEKIMDEWESLFKDVENKK